MVIVESYMLGSKNEIRCDFNRIDQFVDIEGKVFHDGKPVSGSGEVIPRSHCGCESGR